MRNEIGTSQAKDKRTKEKKRMGKGKFHPIKKLLQKHLYISTMKEGDQVKIRN
jgi:hypothetical protein